MGGPGCRRDARGLGRRRGEAPRLGERREPAACRDRDAGEPVAGPANQRRLDRRAGRDDAGVVGARDPPEGERLAVRAAVDGEDVGHPRRDHEVVLPLGDQHRRGDWQARRVLPQPPAERAGGGVGDDRRVAEGGDQRGDRLRVLLVEGAEVGDAADGLACVGPHRVLLPDVVVEGGVGGRRERAGDVGRGRPAQQGEDAGEVGGGGQRGDAEHLQFRGGPRGQRGGPEGGLPALRVAPEDDPVPEPEAGEGASGAHRVDGAERLPVADQVRVDAVAAVRGVVGGDHRPPLGDDLRQGGNPGERRGEARRQAALPQADRAVLPRDHGQRPGRQRVGDEQRGDPGDHRAAGPAGGVQDPPRPRAVRERAADERLVPEEDAGRVRQVLRGVVKGVRLGPGRGRGRRVGGARPVVPAEQGSGGGERGSDQQRSARDGHRRSPSRLAFRGESTGGGTGRAPRCPGRPEAAGPPMPRLPPGRGTGASRGTRTARPARTGRRPPRPGSGGPPARGGRPARPRRGSACRRRPRRRSG